MSFRQILIKVQRQRNCFSKPSHRDFSRVFLFILVLFSNKSQKVLGYRKAVMCQIYQKHTIIIQDYMIWLGHNWPYMY